MRKRTTKPPPAVLVVEDEPLIRMFVSDVLGQSGFEVAEVCDAQQAMAKIENGGKFCAVVTDVQMPGPVDGLELARRLRTDCPRLGVVLVSGVLEPKGMYLPLGVRFVSKPVRAATLLRLVREVADPRADLPPAMANTAP